MGFYMFQSAMPAFVQGLSQVLSCLAVVEISPPGLEATIYEMLISAMNGANALSAAIQSSLVGAFNLDDITAPNWIDNHGSSLPNVEGQGGVLEDNACGCD